MCSGRAWHPQTRLWGGVRAGQTITCFGSAGVCPTPCSKIKGHYYTNLPRVWVQPSGSIAHLQQCSVTIRHKEGFVKELCISPKEKQRVALVAMQ